MLGLVKQIIHYLQASAEENYRIQSVPRLATTLRVAPWDELGTPRQATSPTQERTSPDSRDKKTPEGPPDNMDRLLQAAIGSMKGNSFWSKPVRQYLAAKNAMILVDGWDELSPEQRQIAAEWMSSLTNALSGNLRMVSAGIHG